MRTERPSLLGAQEVLPGQAVFLRDALGASFRFVGYGRAEDGRGEGCPIFYDTDRLELVSWRQTALSSTPDVPGSRSWGNPVPRVLVTALFRDRATGAELLAMNTHLDPLSRRSRVHGAEHVRRRAAAAATPVIVTGDLNDHPSSPAVGALLGGSVLHDAWVAASARLTPEWGTYAGYRRPSVDGRRIDVIAVSSSIEVQCAGINGRVIDGGWPSDHLPVQAVLEVPPAEVSR